MADAGSIGRTNKPLFAATNNPGPISAAENKCSAAPLRGATYSGPFVTVSGTVKIGSVPVARTVRAYRRRDGFLIGEATSSAEDGAFAIDCLGFTGPVTVIALDESEAGEDYNAQIFDLITPA